MITPIAAFFDFDNTLITGDSAKIGIDYLRERKMLPLSYLLRVGAANELFKRNLLSAERMAKLLLTFYKGHELKTFTDGMEEYYQERIRPILAPVPMERLEWHRSQGHLLVLLSGSIQYLLTPVARDLHIDHLLCTRLEKSPEGLLTGRSEGPPCIGVHKINYASRLAQKLGLDLGSSYAYADHQSDLPLMEKVGHPVAVEPTIFLRREAEKRGWPILRHR